MNSELPKPPIGSGSLGPRAAMLGLSIDDPIPKVKKNTTSARHRYSPSARKAISKPKMPRDIPGRKAVVKYVQHPPSTPIDNVVDQSPIIIELTAKGGQAIPVITYDLFKA